MASRTSNAWDRTADGRSSVASELNAIFASLPRVAPVTEPVPPARTVAARKRGLRPWLVFLAAIALAALIGSLAFLMPIARRAPPPHMPPPHAARPIIPPAPLLPAATSPPVLQARTQPQAPHRPKPAVPRVRHEASSPPHHARCSRFATQAWCLHGTIMAADNQLRDAYDAAVRAGVARETLVDIRSDWKKLRGRANRDPQALIRGYALLTQELRAEIRRRR